MPLLEKTPTKTTEAQSKGEPLLRKLLQSTDANNDGKIDTKELSKGLAQSTELAQMFDFRLNKKAPGTAPVPPSFVSGLIKAVDKNGDGLISWDEFKNYLMPLLEKTQIRAQS